MSGNAHISGAIGARAVRVARLRRRIVLLRRIDRRIIRIGRRIRIVRTIIAILRIRHRLADLQRRNDITPARTIDPVFPAIRRPGGLALRTYRWVITAIVAIGIATRPHPRISVRIVRVNLPYFYRRVRKTLAATSRVGIPQRIIANRILTISISLLPRARQGGVRFASIGMNHRRRERDQKKNPQHEHATHHRSP